MNKRLSAIILLIVAMIISAFFSTPSLIMFRLFIRAVIFLGESPTFWQIAGGVLVLSGVWISLQKKRGAAIEEITETAPVSRTGLKIIEFCDLATRKRSEKRFISKPLIPIAFAGKATAEAVVAGWFFYRMAGKKRSRRSRHTINHQLMY